MPLLGADLCFTFQGMQAAKSKPTNEILEISTVQTEEFTKQSLSYDKALQQAMTGNVDDPIIQTMRREHQRILRSGPQNILVNVKIHLAVALLNFANNVNHIGYTTLYKESEKLLLSALHLDPGNSLAISNLETVRKNLKIRGFYAFEEIRLYNPHMTLISRPQCRNVVLRRMNYQRYAPTLFTCDDNTEMGLLWSIESKELEVDEEPINIRAGNNFRVHHFPVYDARGLIWKDDICWISSGGGWTKGTVFMLFHCVTLDSFLSQMDRSARRRKLLPLLHFRGGRIRSDREGGVEKNWSPFIVNDALFITYRSRPHVVMQCDWAAKQDAMHCKTVQDVSDINFKSALDEIKADFRSSSTALLLPPPNENEYLSFGHVMERDYRHFFYRFQGQNPPFQITGFSPLFDLPFTNKSFRYRYHSPPFANIYPRHQVQYGHGFSLESDKVIITYGVDDAEAWYVEIPLPTVKSMLDGQEISLSEYGSHEFPTELFGKNFSEVFSDMISSMENSGTALAEDFLSFYKSIPNVTLHSCFSRISNQRLVYLEAIQDLENLEDACGVSFGGAAEPSTCEDLNLRLDTALSAFWAYATILSTENSILENIFENIQQDILNAASQSNLIPDQETSTGPGILERESSDILPYPEALQLAFLGETSQMIVDSMLQEHHKAEKNNAENLIDIKINLGVALLRLGNQMTDPGSFSRLYQQSELILSSALSMHPGHSMVEGNLEAVQRNYRIRLAVESQDASPQMISAEDSTCNFSSTADTVLDASSGAQSTLQQQARMAYHEALYEAMRGHEYVTDKVVEAMRSEHTRAMESRENGYRFITSINLYTVLQNQASHLFGKDDMKYTRLCAESEKVLLGALELEPTNQNIKSELEAMKLKMQNLNRCSITTV